MVVEAAMILINLFKEKICETTRDSWSPLLVFIISFVAFILIVDTFIVQISGYAPFAEKYLDNLYQSIIDISLFFQNLLK